MAKKIFISYAHADKPLMEELVVFLYPLIADGIISIWNDKAIPAGEIWDEEIKNAIAISDIILLLISAHFLASMYTNNVEIALAFARRRHGARVIPIMLSACDIESHTIPGEKYKISDLHGLPSGWLPVKKWASQDDAWMDVVDKLKKIIGTE